MRREMGSSYFGEPRLGDGRSGSSRKGKKNNLDKPKQPQRGLGVAQLEKIRLRNQMGYCYLPSLHNPLQTNLKQEEDMTVEMSFSSSASSSSYSSSSSFGLNIMMGLGDIESTEVRYGDSQSLTVGWNHNNRILQPQYTTQSSVTQHIQRLPMEDSVQKKRRHDGSDSMGSSSQNSDSSDAQELDLDLKLSL
ncbi:protein SPEAR1-like isoform X2 [Tasmannia lanceolata]|uniref:protein SPEAR1-like isoform X2 n=1 Tax=Tasmannia lanceolata TaxID=3420 RepID=UPI004063372D